MLGVIGIILSLLLGMAALLMGTGLGGTALSLRAGVEGMSPAVTGAVMSAYFVGFILGTFACPGVIRRVGHVRAFAAMAAAASTATLLLPMLPNPLAWAFLRAVAGLSMVGLYMAVESWLNTIATNTNRGRLFAVYQVVCLAALAVGQVLVLAGDVTGMVPFALAAMLITLSLIPVALTTVEQPRPVAALRADLRHLCAVTPSAMAAGFAAGVLNGTLWGMGPLFAHLSGRAEAGVAAFMAATVVGGALLQWPVGWASDRHDRRSVLVAVGAAGALAAVGVILATDGPLPWLAAAAFLYGGMAFSIYGIAVAHMNDVVAPGQALDAARGMLLLHGIGAMLGPAAAGLAMAAFGPVALMYFLAAVMVLMAGQEMAGRLARPRARPAAPTAFVPVLRSSQAALELDPRLAPDAASPSATPGGADGADR